MPRLHAADFLYHLIAIRIAQAEVAHQDVRPPRSISAGDSAEGTALARGATARKGRHTA